MRINQITLRVKNLDASKAFYQGYFGMQVTKEICHDELKIAFLTDGNAMQIELMELAEAPDCGLYNKQFKLGITVENFDELLNKCQEAQIVTNGPLTIRNILECFIVRDPDCLSIQIFRKN